MDDDVVWVKCRLHGEPARIVRELKAKGVAYGVRELVIQGLMALEEKTLEREIRQSRNQLEKRGGERER